MRTHLITSSYPYYEHRCAHYIVLLEEAKLHPARIDVNWTIVYIRIGTISPVQTDGSECTHPMANPLLLRLYYSRFPWLCAVHTEFVSNSHNRTTSRKEWNKGRRIMKLNFMGSTTVSEMPFTVHHTPSFLGYKVTKNRWKDVCTLNRWRRKHLHINQLALLRRAH